MKLELRNIAKSYDKKTKAINNLSFSLTENKVVCIIGPSGSGKSSIMRIVAGLDKFDSGSIFVDDKLIKTQEELLQSDVQLVFQDYNLFKNMNVLENLTYAAVATRYMTIDAARLKAEKLLFDFKIENKIINTISSLSGGQKQRVAIARALMMDPKILLMDEPTAALDPVLTSDFYTIVNSLRQKMAIIVVTHEFRLAKLIADRIIFMSGGEILMDRSTTEFMSSYADYDQIKEFVDKALD